MPPGLTDCTCAVSYEYDRHCVEVSCEKTRASAMAFTGATPGRESSGAAYSGLLGVVISGLLFFSMVLAGLITRRRPDYHKRFMLLATIVVLWPAWFRFRHYFPSVPHPEIWFALVLADSLIVISWFWEWLTLRKIHPVLLCGGLFIIIEQTTEVIIFDSPGWRLAARWLYEVFN